MKTKLTLSIDKDLARFAHSAARRKGTSVSRMFSEYLQTKKTESERKQVQSNIRSKLGSLKGYQIQDSKEAIRKAYGKKYSSH